MIANTRRVAIALALAFLVVSGGLVYWQIVRAGSLSVNPANPRAAEAALRTDRGRILDRNGVVLAQSTRQPDGTFARSYALNSLAQTIGYVSTRYGLAGLEQSYDGYLDGTQAANPAQRAEAELLHVPTPGDDLVLTIDSKLQQAAASALGNRPGAVVALDPHTGAVLAMVSAPAFDPARIDTQGASLASDASKPLLNRATQGLYPPGSVYKIVTASAALDSGTVKPTDIYRCSGSGVVIQGFVIGCENAPPNQTQWDFKTAFAYSINATFAQVAVQLGSDRFIAYSRRFGMDSPLHFDVGTATSATSHSGGGLDQVLLANSGFGQGQLEVTPLQIALIGATIANGGVEPQPYLVQEIHAANGSILQEHQSGGGRQVVSANTAQEMTQFMLAAVQEFGATAGLLNIDVAGKTGTAETGTPGVSDSWFVGFTPSQNPGLVVAVIVENGGPGSQAAAPVARQVFQAFTGH